MLAKNLLEAAGNSQESAEVAEAIDFDGPDDYLSRSTDLVGNADGKTFTFSCWVWDFQSVNAYRIYNADTGSAERFEIRINLGRIFVYGYNSGGTQILYGYASQTDGSAAIQTWTNILVSVDLSNSANRYIYANDVSLATTWITYTNTNIDFSTAYHRIARGYNSLYPFKGRLSNVYLDYTYRDLSVEANRRLFVTADLKPAADQASLNPILYLPMDDPTAPGANAGTGGNFTLTGTVARSGRGPNQYNAPYSDLDGSADYLSRTTITGIADGTQGTFSCVFSLDNFVVSYTSLLTNANNYVYVAVRNTGYLLIDWRNSSNQSIAEFTSPAGGIVLNRNYHLVISLDCSNTSKRHVYLNGEALSGTWVTYNTSGTINFNRSNYVFGASSGPNGFVNGRQGALWFNTSYIDLSNPDNLAKFVTGTGIDAKPVDLGANGELPTGTAPLIYLPMYGSNAGKNYGTGGDFTVNSGPFTGARGPNEFWGNKATFDGVISSLQKASALNGVSDTKTASCSFWVMPGPVSGGEYWFYMDNGAGSLRGFVITFSNTNLRLQAYNSSGTQIFEAYVNSPEWGAGSPFYVQMSFDLANSANRSFYVNGAAASVSWSPYTNQNMSFTTASRVFFGGDGTYYPAGSLSEFYFTTEYIDFSQEANRLKFRDAFGNPVDLTQQIEDAAIPNPAIYMRFDPASFGTNSGTGGNFTVNGTITDGGQL